MFTAEGWCDARFYGDFLTQAQRVTSSAIGPFPSSEVAGSGVNVVGSPGHPLPAIQRSPRTPRHQSLVNTQKAMCYSEESKGFHMSCVFL